MRVESKTQLLESLCGITCCLTHIATASVTSWVRTSLCDWPTTADVVLTPFMPSFKEIINSSYHGISKFKTYIVNRIGKVYSLEHTDIPKVSSRHITSVTVTLM
jgi:hypothetical protein